MLSRIGVGSTEELMKRALPATILLEDHEDADLGVPPAASEAQVLAELQQFARRNEVFTSMIGQGYYDTVTPSVIQRLILEDPAWYTAYTPYQPEISQGRLEALINFQTMVTDLTGLDVAGSSMLDEGTAAAEAMLLSMRVSRRERRFLVDRNTLPRTKQIIRDRAAAMGIELVEIDVADTPDPAVFDGAGGVLLSTPAADGSLPAFAQLQAWAQAAHEAKALVTAVTDLLASTLVVEVSAWGADIAVGTTQRFGVPMGFGGPHAGFLAVRSGLERQLPGRLVGVSKDAKGQVAYRLALQTREQHIRREKATSNISTAQVLLAVMASMYAVYHGPDGLKAIASRVHEHARAIAAGAHERGIPVLKADFFDTVALGVEGRAEELRGALAQRRINIHVANPDTVQIAADELTTEEIVAEVLQVLSGFASSRGSEPIGIAEESRRTTPFLTHPEFNSYHTDTSMTRYITDLGHKDFALDRVMIPLGSCTMKLNSATELAALTWPEFSRIHPHAPNEQVGGYLELIDQLQRWLAGMTGYAAVSVQPNAGSQGELAGLLAIRRYHDSRGETQRDLCLVPASAHGTNAASAILAGYTVKVVATAENGDIDLDDLARLLEEFGERVGAIMITYPSTHGVYEGGIREVCAAVHEAGGQVYIDGANFNALLGWAHAGKFGGDVSHLNLHKTFAIPHGGGGPGVGPVAVAEHLRPFLPDAEHGPAISSAPYGSALILTISWAYIRLMGAEGLREATTAAVLHANYIAEELDAHYPVLYRGERGHVAHECIIDLRGLSARTGVTVDDVAKRLIDYGFHAPTMSFPDPGTLMIEQAESEDLKEIDRFLDAMNGIREEILRVETGDFDAADSPLRNAPHTAESLTGEWDYPYSRAEAVYPAGTTARKYWPPVRRIDGAYGDRNLMCSCPPIEELAD